MSECLDDNEVVDLLEARLDASSVDRLTRHLDSCPDCRRLVGRTARVAAAAVGSVPEQGTPLSRGACVGRYVVLERLGVGSMGVVYAAFDPELDRRVALKLLRTDVAPDARATIELRERLVREARTLARLSHPNITTLFDVGAHEGEVFLAMELVPGGTLAAWLHAEKRSHRSILERFRQAGEGLAAAHAEGIVHRDFKPENVLIGADGRVRVSDFGLARALDDPGQAPPPLRLEDPGARPFATLRTLTGALVGTPAYMAPEQWAGQPSDARTDVFAFSVALYEALYGERPFRAESALALRSAVARNQVEPPGASSRVPGSVRRVLLRGLRADPAERYPTMRALLDELAPGRSRRGWILGVLLALGSILAVAALAPRRPAPPVCNAAAAEWGDVFEASQALAVKNALGSTHDPRAESAFAIVSRGLADYRRRWIAIHTDACVATRVRGQQSEALLDLRMQCLVERRRAAVSLVRSIENGAAEGLVEHAVHGVGELARVDDCADTRALAEPVPMPGDSATRGRVLDLRARAADAEGAAIEPSASLAVLDPLLAEARELGWAPLVARLLYDHATRLSRLRRNREAEQELHEAAVMAEAAHADGIVLDSWTRLLYLVGYQEYRVSDGLLWGRYAAAALARQGAVADPRAAILHEYTGLVLLNDELRLDESRENFERALTLWTELEGAEGGGVAGCMSELSMVLFTMARPEEAIVFERGARAIMEKRLGSESVDVALSLGNEGEEQLESGRVDEALPLLRRSAEMQERLGRNDAAVLGVIARALRLQGAAADALDVDRRALALVEANEAPGAYDLSFPDLGVALDLLALARGKEALSFAERAAELRQATMSTSERGEARFALARALWQTGERRSARLQARDARTDYEVTAERYGGRYRNARDAIDAWLATHAG